MSTRTGFTLVEVLVVVGIAGIIIVTAITPLTFSVRTVREAQKNFSANNRERFAVNQLFRDAREVMGIHAATPFRLIRGDELGGKANDTLLLWTKTPAYTNASAGCVAYGRVQKSILGSDFPEGLYRWVLSDDRQPGKVEANDLDAEKGQLVLSGVEGVRFSVMDSGAWTDDYAGSCPQALRITLNKEGRDIVYEGWLPQF